MNEIKQTGQAGEPEALDLELQELDEREIPGSVCSCTSCSCSCTSCSCIIWDFS